MAGRRRRWVREEGFRGMSSRPTIGTHGFRDGHRVPFRGGVVRGGVVHGGDFVRHGGNFVRHGAFVHGHGFVGPVHFFHPYYAFHPNVSIGFGLWAGYPFAYPYAFYNPYYYPLLSVLLVQPLPSLWVCEFGRLRVKFRRGA
jgi:hypothetical protein